MKLSSKQFADVMTIISSYHTTKVLINKPINGFVGDMGIKFYTIHITECCASVVKVLTSKGYSLSMTEYGLLVSKY